MALTRARKDSKQQQQQQQPAIMAATIRRHIPAKLRPWTIAIGRWLWVIAPIRDIDGGARAVGTLASLPGWRLSGRTSDLPSGWQAWSNPCGVPARSWYDGTLASLAAAHGALDELNDVLGAGDSRRFTQRDVAAGNAQRTQRQEARKAKPAAKPAAKKTAKKAA